MKLSMLLSGLLLLPNGASQSPAAEPANKPATPVPALAPAPPPFPKLISKEVYLRHRDGRPASTGFISYISATEPVLIHCHGWQDYSDGYDDYSVSFSPDRANGDVVLFLTRYGEVSEKEWMLANYHRYRVEMP